MHYQFVPEALALGLVLAALAVAGLRLGMRIERRKHPETTAATRAVAGCLSSALLALAALTVLLAFVHPEI